MKLDKRQVGDVVVLSLGGRLVRGVGDQLLRNAIDETLADGTRKLVLDLSAVPFIDSSGIGELVAAKRVASELGATIKLVRLEERVARTLRLSMILPLFQTFANEREALEAFGGS